MADPLAEVGRPEKRGDTREQILQAAERILKAKGLGACTTRAIAEEAGCAEGSIYRHFADKHELFIEIVKRRFPAFLDMVESLPDLAGKGDLRPHVQDLARAALLFYREILPMAAGVAAHHDLLIHQREHFVRTDTGPMKVFASVAAFFEREQRAGRVAGDVSPWHAARVLLGACFVQAYLEFLLGEPARVADEEEWARETVRVVLDGLQPPARRRAPAASVKASRGSRSPSRTGTRSS
jgi:AcrR family transcriptional regulator